MVFILALITCHKKVFFGRFLEHCKQNIAFLHLLKEICLIHRKSVCSTFVHCFLLVFFTFMTSIHFLESWVSTVCLLTVIHGSYIVVASFLSFGMLTAKLILLEYFNQFIGTFAIPLLLTPSS